MTCFSKTLLAAALCMACFSIQPSIAQPIDEISPTQWREDLYYFKEVIHTKYRNLFYNVTEKQFDSAVKAVEKKIGTLGDVQMRVEFAKLVAMFKVGHTMVRHRYGTGNEIIPWVNPIPVTFYLFPDGLYIKSIDSKYKEAAGGKIISIGTTDVKTALEKIRPVVAYENEQGFKSMLPIYLNKPEFLQATGIIDDTKTVSITYLKDGKEKTIVMHAEPMAQQQGHGVQTNKANRTDAYEGKNTPLWLKEPGRLRYFEYLPSSKTVYVRHSAVQHEPGETIDDFFAKVFDFTEKNDVEKFILDLRMNGGGNNYLNRPVITGLIQAKKINQKGKLFIITGKATFSAAQNLTNELEKYTEAIFVGEPTSENVNFFGDTRTEILPNSKSNINLSWLWWQNHDPRDKRQWTAPQLAVDMSFNDYKNGVDPVVNTILSYKHEEQIENLVRKLAIEGKTEEAISAARKYLENPLYRYYQHDLENKINNAGYVLMNENKFKEANNLLGVNVSLYPGSANVYDSYAESWLKLGNREESVKYYELAVSKDPHGATGENARKALKEIEERKGF